MDVAEVRVANFSICLALATIITSSFHDQAIGAEPTDTMIRNLSAFSNCVRSNVHLYQGDIHAAKKMGMDVESMLAVQCRVLLGAYIHYCQEAGFEEDACYGDARLVVKDQLKQVGE